MNYQLIKIDTTYDKDYTKFLLSNTQEYQELINIFKLSRIKIVKNQILNKFAAYFKENLDSILKTQSLRFRGKIFLISDGRYPLSAYMTKDKNVVINFTRKISEYSKYEILSILLYGFTYWMVFNNKKFLHKNKNQLIYDLTLVVYNFLINIFGKHFGAFNEDELLDNCKILSGVFVVTLLWKEDFGKYMNFIYDKMELKNRNAELEQIVKGLNSLNLDIFKWIKLLDSWCLYGITSNFFIDQIMRRYSSEFLVAFESLPRLFSVIYGSVFSSYFGTLEYILPKKESNDICITITKNIMSLL